MVDSSSFFKTNLFEFANFVLFLFCMPLFSSYRPSCKVSFDSYGLREFFHHKNNDDITIHCLKSLLESGKLQRVTKLHDGLLISSPYRKMNFRGLGSAQGQNGFGQCRGLCNTDFNTEKNHGVLLRKFGEKKCFRPKV